VEVIADILELVNARPEVRLRVDGSRPSYLSFQNPSFYDTVFRDLDRLNITAAGLLVLRRGGVWEKKADAAGRGGAPSSAELYERLEHLQTLTSDPVGCCCSTARD